MDEVLIERVKNNSVKENESLMFDIRDGLQKKEKSEIDKNIAMMEDNGVVLKKDEEDEPFICFKPRPDEAPGMESKKAPELVNGPEVFTKRDIDEVP